jgi:protein TonB
VVKPNTASDEADAGTRIAKANKPAESPAPRTIELKNSMEHPSTASDDASPPAITAMPSASDGAMPSLMEDAGSSTAPRLQTLNVSQGVSRGLLVKQVQPTYPPEAMRLKIAGQVQLMATISKSGDISAVKILSGDSRLAHGAAEAVKQWKYKPYLLNGEPVEIQTQVTINFKLPQ